MINRTLATKNCYRFYSSSLPRVNLINKKNAKLPNEVKIAEILSKKKMVDFIYDLSETQQNL
jgi:hypothetical protein